MQVSDFFTALTQLRCYEIVLGDYNVS